VKIAEIKGFFIRYSLLPLFRLTYTRELRKIIRNLMNRHSREREMEKLYVR
jgi:hypothetical protein